MTTTAAAAPTHDLTRIATPIGTAIAGGFYAGLIKVADEVFALIMSPVAGQLAGAWNTSYKTVPGAESYSDGLANTQAMAAAGSPLATAALALTIDGLTDWYIPSRDEQELQYRHFKPTTSANLAWDDDGTNGHSIPAGSPHTADSPAQTTLIDFQRGGVHAMPANWHWSSTQYAPYPNVAWYQGFSNGDQFSSHKTAEGRARAVRRLPIQSFINLIEAAAQQSADAAASNEAVAA